MKRKISISWKASKQPRKQRKYLANAPLHLKGRFLSANLTKELRKKHGKRSLPLRKGDTVKIMVGKFRGKQGKVTNVNRKMSGIEVEGILIKKQDGSKVNVKLQPSNVQIIELNLEDSRRIGTQKETKKEDLKKKTEIKNAP